MTTAKFIFYYIGKVKYLFLLSLLVFIISTISVLTQKTKEFSYVMSHMFNI